MTVVTTVVTFVTGAIQPFAGVTQARRVRIEPLRSNTHGMVVGLSNVVNDASGAGVIQEIAQPPGATVPVDYFQDEAQTGHNIIEAQQYYVQGTAGEKAKCTYWQL